MTKLSGSSSASAVGCTRSFRVGWKRPGAAAPVRSGRDHSTASQTSWTTCASPMGTRRRFRGCRVDSARPRRDQARLKWGDVLKAQTAEERAVEFQQDTDDLHCSWLESAVPNVPVSKTVRSSSASLAGRNVAQSGVTRSRLQSHDEVRGSTLAPSSCTENVTGAPSCPATLFHKASSPAPAACPARSRTPGCAAPIARAGVASGVTARRERQN